MANWSPWETNSARAIESKRTQYFTVRQLVLPRPECDSDFMFGACRMNDSTVLSLPCFAHADSPSSKLVTADGSMCHFRLQADDRDEIKTPLTGGFGQSRRKPSDIRFPELRGRKSRTILVGPTSLAIRNSHETAYFDRLHFRIFNNHAL